MACKPFVRSWCNCFKAGGNLFFLHTGNRVADLRDAVVQAETGSLQRRTPIIRQRGSHGQAVVSDRFIFRRGVFFQGALDGSHPSQLLLQKGFGMPIGFIERLHGIFEIMKLTELMGDLWEDKSHRTPDRLFAIRDDAFDRHFQWLQQPLDFLQQRGQIPLGTTEQRSSQQDFFGKAIAHHPEHPMPHIGLQAGKPPGSRVLAFAIVP